MFRRNPNYFLVAANLVPVVGVWAFHWDPIEIFTVYCLETILVGIFQIVRLTIAGVARKTDIWYNREARTRVSWIVFILFFLAHYGIFVAVQMGIFFSVSGAADYYQINLSNFFVKWPLLLSGDSILLLGVFFVAYGFAMLRDFIISKQYKTVPMMLLMFQPYLRIFIQQLTVILGSMFLVFGAGKIFITVFALVKTFFELYLNYDGLLSRATAYLKERSGKQ